MAEVPAMGTTGAGQAAGLGPRPRGRVELPGAEVPGVPPGGVLVAQGLSGIVAAVTLFLVVVPIVLGMFVVLTEYVIAGNGEYPPDPRRLATDAVVLVVAGSLVILLGLVVLGLGRAGGGRARVWRVRARRAGVAGGVLTMVSGVAIALAPLQDPIRSTEGGWGQPWMPEVLVGALAFAVGAALLWSLLTRSTREWVHLH